MNAEFVDEIASAQSQSLDTSPALWQIRMNAGVNAHPALVVTASERLSVARVVDPARSLAQSIVDATQQLSVICMQRSLGRPDNVRLRVRLLDDIDPSRRSPICIAIRSRIHHALHMKRTHHEHQTANATTAIGCCRTRNSL